MGFSDDVEQQRASEVKLLRRWVGWGLAGSLLLHGLSLPLLIRESRKASKPRPTEVTIVPRKLPPVIQKPQPMPTPEPELEPELEPKLEPELEPEQPTQTLSAIATESQILPPGVIPEGDPDALQDESPLVGSGLAEGEGGFAEGIGLNRSTSSIRGSGGGARRGVEGGVPGGIIAPPIVTAPLLPAIEEQPEPLPEPADPRQAVCRQCPSPEYPRAALQAGVEGRVQLAVDVDSQGRVIGVRLANSSGNSDIDRAVLATVRERWRFEDLRSGANNIPVEVYMTVNQSELNRRAQDWGDRTAVEIPSSGFAAPPVTPDTAATSRSEPSVFAPRPTVEPIAKPTEPTEPTIEPNVTSSEPPIAPSPQPIISLPEPILESVSESELLPIEPVEEPVNPRPEEVLSDAIAPPPAPQPVDEP